MSERFVPPSFPCAVCGASSEGLFAEVPLCADHLTYTSSFFAKRQEQLNAMLLALKENIRASLLDGRLPK